MSTNAAGRLNARRRVKAKFVESQGAAPLGRALGIVPAMARPIGGVKMPLRMLAGRPLLDYPIRALLAVPEIDRIIVSTEDDEIASLARKLGADVPGLRPAHLSRAGVSVEAVVQNMLQELERREEYHPSLLAIAHVHSPFLRGKHITEAMHSMSIYSADSVISVTKDLTFHWRRGVEGLEPVGYQKRLLRAEKDIIFKETGALYVVRAEHAHRQDLIGKRVGHVEMLPEEALRIENEQDFLIAETMLATGQYV
jgi:N-acylneuraminate cytidylyltransferase